MSAFCDLVARILRCGIPLTGFGAKHFKAGMDPDYHGPKYGKTTVQDAYFEAGRRYRKNKEAK